MGNEVSTMAQIMAAQHAGDIGAGIYAAATPGIIAAVAFIGFLIVVAILIGIFKHFFVKEDNE